MAPTRANGLDTTSYARCEDVGSVSEERLVRRLGAVDLAVELAVAQVLRRFLEL